MTSPIADAVDRVDREDYELFRSLAYDLRRSISSFGFDENAGPAIDMDIPSSCQTARQKAAAAEAVYVKLAHFVNDEIIAAVSSNGELLEKFVDAMSGITIADVTSQELASMSSGRCKEALLLACKLIFNKSRTLGLRNAMYLVDLQRLKAKDSHEKLFYGEAVKADQALRHATELLSQLHREKEETTKLYSDLNDAIKAATERLGMLARDITSKPAAAGRKETKLPPQLENVIINVKHMLDKERTKTKRLQEQVKYFKKQLDAYDPDTSKKVLELQAELDAARAEGSATKKLADELAEKLRCQICMDRQRDAAFACGHTCCKQCSVEWKKCTFNCVSERRQKPVKFTFPLYFN